ncbi:MAG TPA: hypothetical protein VNW04_16575 [Puia sp.]|jgi:hypothetical protein|nr:hypothetical protein [Puia sp.]
MKKTTGIKLVLITAALAACNKPMYQQGYYSDPVYYSGDQPDSTNSCPIEYSQLPPDYYNWLYGFRPYGGFYVNPSINFYYLRYYRGTVTRAGFGSKINTISS